MRRSIVSFRGGLERAHGVQEVVLVTLGQHRRLELKLGSIVFLLVPRRECKAAAVEILQLR